MPDMHDVRATKAKMGGIPDMALIATHARTQTISTRNSGTAGDKNTKALSEALRQRLSTSKEEERPLPPQDSPRIPEHIKDLNEFETVV
jgi:hypothetical protein